MKCLSPVYKCQPNYKAIYLNCNSFPTILFIEKLLFHSLQNNRGIQIAELVYLTASGLVKPFTTIIFNICSLGIHAPCTLYIKTDTVTDIISV